MDLNKLKDIIREEIEILTDFFSILEELQNKIINKSEVSEINSTLLNIEKKSSNFWKIDEERNEILNKICTENKIKNNIKEVIEFFSKENKEIAILLAKLVETMNEFTIKLDMLRQIIGFQTNFDNLIIKLINIDKTGKTTYGKNGYNKNIEPSNNGWRG
ncbi:hypothetical protein OSSY52_05870 [Tepiditoga spiralis]|uniref:FlgN protein n=1 Tax=Tepiditoga spiralis TaxID=2108365 RepID=A0A7G1G598_9BACT|nr:flagellar export chaperone FlgN [Tepiditoga spiralis]BBE30446.1 hypothetical protein OSSY52_05870 [Tepiditoga spiralis]